MKINNIHNISLLRFVPIVAFALLFSACNRKVTAEDFQIEVVSIENTASWVNVGLRLNSPQKAGDVTAFWTSGYDMAEGTLVTFAKQDDFDVEVVVSPENGPSSITLNANIDLRARLLAGGEGITDYRSEFLGIYSGTYRHDHFDEFNGLVLMENGESSVTVTKADATQPANFLKLEYQNPNQSTFAAVNALGDGNFGYYNYLNFKPDADSLYLTVTIGGQTSYERYTHHVKR